MATISGNAEINSIRVKEQAAAPATPAAGYVQVYAKADGLLYSKDDAGVESALSPALASASVKRTAGDLTTTSTVFVDVDPSFSLTITTGARRVLIGFVGVALNSVAGGVTSFDVAVDGTRLGGAQGLSSMRVSSASFVENVGFVVMTDPLAAGSHTFTLQWFVNANTGTLQGSSTGRTALFWVKEIS